MGATAGAPCRRTCRRSTRCASAETSLRTTSRRGHERGKIRRMSAQQITPELRKWIVAQAQAGHTPESVLQAMRSSGWDEEIAINALEDTLQGFLAEHAKAAGLPAP